MPLVQIDQDKVQSWHRQLRQGHDAWFLDTECWIVNKPQPPWIMSNTATLVETLMPIVPANIEQLVSLLVATRPPTADTLVLVLDDNECEQWSDEGCVQGFARILRKALDMPRLLPILISESGSAPSRTLFPLTINALKAAAWTPASLIFETSPFVIPVSGTPDYCNNTPHSTWMNALFKYDADAEIRLATLSIDLTQHAILFTEDVLGLYIHAEDGLPINLLKVFALLQKHLKT